MLKKLVDYGFLLLGTFDEVEGTLACFSWNNSKLKEECLRTEASGENWMNK